MNRKGDGSNDGFILPLFPGFCFAPRWIWSLNPNSRLHHPSIKHRKAWRDLFLHYPNYLPGTVMNIKTSSGSTLNKLGKSNMYFKAYLVVFLNGG